MSYPSAVAVTEKVPAGTVLTARRYVADALAITLLIALTAIVAWQQFALGRWLARVDILQYYFPSYAFLGEQLRSFHIPGWNPHQFSGNPFAGDPQSGWMYFPVMIFFTAFNPVVAYKLLVIFHLLFAGVTAYLLARILGMGVLAAIVAAVAFEFGPFEKWTAACCTIYANVAVWVPLSLIGIELAVRSRSRLSQAAAVCLTGIAISQMFGGWIGQGSYYGLLVVGSYVFFRTVLSPPVNITSPRQRVTALLTLGSAVLLAGIALGAAGIWPRLDVNGVSTMAADTYNAITNASPASGWDFNLMLRRMLTDNYGSRRLAFGTAIVMLALLAPILSWRRFSTIYFAVMTVIGLVLMLDVTPIHRLLYLLPRFQQLHEHDERRIISVLVIGPAFLAAATVESLHRRRLPPPAVALAFVPAGFYIAVWAYLRTFQESMGSGVWVNVTLVTFLLLIALIHATGRVWKPASSIGQSCACLPLIFALVIFMSHPGAELFAMARGHADDPRLADLIAPHPEFPARTKVFTATTDPGGAGAFLQRQQAQQSTPFRYFGYEPIGLRTMNQDGTTYHGELDSSHYQPLLTGARAMRLGLYDIQGYNPVHLKRYRDFLQAINGVPLDYHDEVILASGSSSPLLNLLNVQYIVIPAHPLDEPSRPDITRLTSAWQEVFRNSSVVVLKNPDVLPYAWIVYDAQITTRSAALTSLKNGAVNPRQTVLLETAAPALNAPADTASDRVQVTSYEPDRIELTAHAGGAGMLVLSEMYGPGWRADIDGQQTPIYAADTVLRAIRLPAGDHSIRFSYDPPSLRYGLIVSSVTGITILLIFAAVAWRVLG
ncbi:MAG TPA: YfhO family protein, partial [Thermomicrobiales bacterium]|nr:YfhO family protein [Thermomicrobiales bacterium]